MGHSSGETCGWGGVTVWRTDMRTKWRRGEWGEIRNDGKAEKRNVRVNEQRHEITWQKDRRKWEIRVSGEGRGEEKWCGKGRREEREALMRSEVKEKEMEKNMRGDEGVWAEIRDNRWKLKETEEDVGRRWKAEVKKEDRERFVKVLKEAQSCHWNTS